MGLFYIDGVVTSGSYFTYEGVRYGQYTIVTFTKEGFKHHGLTYYNRTLTFHSIERGEDGKLIWKFCVPNFAPYYPLELHDFDWGRDIEKIATPVYYMTPRELAKSRLRDGTWIFYVWQQTLVYVLCLIISPIFQQWYLIWTMGLYLYLRLCYIELSKGGLNRGW